MKESARGLDIRAEGFQFDSIAEMAAHFHDGRIGEVEIRTSSPYVTIELTQIWAKLYVGSSENATAGMFYRTDKVLRAARRPLWPLYSSNFVWTLSVGFFVSTVCVARTGVAVTTVLSAVISAWVVWVGNVTLRRYSSILLERRGSASFWSRRKDDLLSALVAALLGAILATAGTLLVQYLGK